MKTFRELCDAHTQSRIAALVHVTPAAISIAYNGSVSAAMLAKLDAVFGDEFDVVKTLREHRRDDYEAVIPARLRAAEAAISGLSVEERHGLLARLSAMDRSDHATEAA